MNCFQKHLLLSLIFLPVLSGPAWAHAAEQGFVLLLPTTAYITAGTCAVAVTIFLMFALRREQLESLFKPWDTGLDVSKFDPKTWTSYGASLVLLTIVFVGLFGPTDPQSNLLPLVLWTVVWMAVFVIQGTFFDLWRWINPWVVLHQLIDPNDRPLFTIPERLSVWPAAVLFTVFQGFVLADVAPNDPTRIATLTLGYTGLTLIGMSLFGRQAWLQHVECFSVLFHIIGKMRILKGGDSVKFGMPGWQASEEGDGCLSHAFFILIVLAAGSFDGLYETFWWLGKVGVNPLEFPGRTAMFWTTTVGLFFAIILLILIFAASVWVGIAAVKNRDAANRIDFKTAFVAFSVSLIPIATGYHFAHYFVTFLVQIQVTVATIADPLAAGWNLFGLDGTRVKVGFLIVPSTVKLIWVTQATVVVFSHIFAVMLTHRAAMRLCGDTRDVFRLQIGLSLLMVAYTIFGLWLLASPRGV